MADNAGEVIADVISEAVLMARSGEALKGLYRAVSLVTQLTSDLITDDVELGPEIKTVVHHLGEIGGALERATHFVEARLVVAVERATAALEDGS